MGRLLKQILQMDNLAAAWEEVAGNRGGPGIDQVTIEEFARHWEGNLVELRQAVRSGYYRPDPLQRFAIPKRDGSLRWLGNPTVRDKVLQRAVLRVLADRYEQQFLECSFGYRPRRSVRQAVERVVEARDFGRTWVLDADIDDFFHSLDHALLLRFLGESITDEPLLHLIRIWLDSGRPQPDQAVGTPLGAIISPLLSNIYLHYLDLMMSNGLPESGWGEGQPLSYPRHDWVYLRYADDFVVLCRSKAQALLALEWVEAAVTALRLKLEASKTAITTFADGFEYLGCSFKDDHFYFHYQDKAIRVREDEDWALFYRYGPEGYQE
jgi:group II intron reverse transcriptase/maturase